MPAQCGQGVGMPIFFCVGMPIFFSVSTNSRAHARAYLVHACTARPVGLGQYCIQVALPCHIVGCLTVSRGGPAFPRPGRVSGQPERRMCTAGPGPSPLVPGSPAASKSGPGLVAPGADITGDPTFVALIHWQSQCHCASASGKTTPLESQDNPGYPSIGFVDWDNPG